MFLKSVTVNQAIFFCNEEKKEMLRHQEDSLNGTMLSRPSLKESDWALRAPHMCFVLLF